MKKTINALFVVLLFAGLVLSTGCNKDKKTTKEINKNIVDGTWRITNMTDDGENETHHFSGFNFTFSDNGSVLATNGTISYTGTWSVSNSNSNDDSNSSSDVDFNLQFTVSDDHDFDDLNDDWDISSQSKTKIELTDVSGGNGGTDYLTFEKN